MASLWYQVLSIRVNYQYHVDVGVFKRIVITTIYLVTELSTPPIFSGAMHSAHFPGIFL